MRSSCEELPIFPAVYIWDISQIIRGCQFFRGAPIRASQNTLGASRILWVAIGTPRDKLLGFLDFEAIGRINIAASGFRHWAADNLPRVSSKRKEGFRFCGAEGARGGSRL